MIGDAMRCVMGDEPGHRQALGAGMLCRSRCTGETELTASSECGPGNGMTYVQLSGPKDRKIAWLRTRLSRMLT